MAPAQSERRSLLVLLFAAAALVALTFSPLFSALVLAAVLTIAAWPLHVRLTRLFRRRASLSAGALVVATALLIVGPVAALLTYLITQAPGAWQFVLNAIRSEQFIRFYQRLPGGLRHFLDEFFVEGATGPLSEQLGALSTRVMSALGKAATATGSILFTLAMGLIALYLMLVQKDAIVAWIKHASPLSHRQTRELLEEFRSVTSAVIRSTFASAFAQGLAGFIGFLIAGVPHAFFFATILFFVAIIPAGVTVVVSLLLALFLGLTGHVGAAIFLALWGICVVGLVDNVVKPLLIKGKGKTSMSGGLVFFALIGGLIAFGPIGLLLGPLAVSLFVACLRIYKRDYEDEPVTTEAPAAPKS